MFASVVELWQFLAPLPAVWGLPIWAGILWKRCNGFGAWVGLLGSTAIWLFTKYHLEWELADQVVWYLSGGSLLIIITSLLTPEQPKALLDKFYAVLHTPVGKEDELRAAGIEVRK